MTEVGTLEQLQLSVGDIFVSASSREFIPYTVTSVEEGGVRLSWTGSVIYGTKSYKNELERYKHSTHIYRVIFRATPISIEEFL